MDTFINDIIKKIKSKKIVYRVIMMIISLLISSIVFNLFLLPTNIVSGGVNGISIITDYLYGYNPSTVILIISLACVVLSFIYLGIERTTGTLVATILYPIFVQLTSNIGNYITIDINDLFIISIYIGIIGGFANGLMYKTGFSCGGLPIISQILYKYFRIPISKSSFVINSIIVFIGGIFFGSTKVMYAIIILYINSIILNKVLLGISNNKAFYIITTEDKKIKEYIIKEMKHSATIFDVKGGFLEKKRKVILTVIPSREYFKVTEGIKLIDKNAFFVVTDAYEVSGGR